jgi:hypothetical protein
MPLADTLRKTWDRKPVSIIVKKDIGFTKNPD